MPSKQTQAPKQEPEQQNVPENQTPVQGQAVTLPSGNKRLDR